METIIDSFGLNPKLFLAEAVNFLIVIAVIYYVVSKKIFPKLEERVGIIKKGVENAEKSEEILKDSKDKATEIVKESQKEADENVKKSVDLAKEKERQILEKASEKEKDMISDAKDKAEAEKDKIINSSKDEIAKMIVLGAEKVLSK